MQVFLFSFFSPILTITQYRFYDDRAFHTAQYDL